MDLALILNNLVKKSHRVKTLITNNHTATQYDSLLLDSSNGSFTITLPADPIIGSRIPLVDVGGALANHPVTIDGNSKTINDNSTITLTGDYNAYNLVYYNETRGWRLSVSPSSDGSAAVIGSGGIGTIYTEPLVDNTSDFIYDNSGDIVTSTISK